jgi:hypothetical protein
MRILGLLVLLCGVCAAGDSVRQGSSPQAAVNFFNSDASISGIVRPSNLASGDRADRDRSRTDGDVTCYTIQSYLVKRESPHSDAITPAGYSTCVPASKYGVKMVEESGKAPAR